MEEKINTYIINLEKDIERKSYILKVLSNYSDIIEPTIITGINGYQLSDNELNQVFDRDLAYKRYGRPLNKGEVGCTLSHYKCYKSLCESNNNLVLILEDDITILNDLQIINYVRKIADSQKPEIYLLSSDYWYTRLKKINNQHSIASIFDAVGTYAYIINRAAAERILQKLPKPSHIADGWTLYKSLGIKLYAIHPYLIDANIENFESSIKQEYFGEKRQNMRLKFRLRSYWISFRKRILLKRGHFISKIRK